MQDRTGYKLNIGTIVRVFNEPSIPDSDTWVFHDFIEMGVHTYYFFRNCFTNEIRIFDPKNIERI